MHSDDVAGQRDTVTGFGWWMFQKVVEGEGKTD